MSLYRIYYTGIKDDPRQTWIVEDQNAAKVQVCRRVVAYVPVEFTPGINGPRPSAVAWVTGRLEMVGDVANIYPEEIFTES